MAEAILFHIAGETLMKLSSQACQRLGIVIGLKDDLNKLTSTVSTIKDVLLDAEERQTKSRPLQNWLHKLEEALYDAEDVLDELSTEALLREVVTRDHKYTNQVRIFFSRSNQIVFSSKMARQIKNMWERLAAIDAEKRQFHLRESCEPRTPYGSFDPIMMRRETWSSSNEGEVIGRDDDKEKVKNLLLDMNMNAAHNVSIVAIVGMGGIGKTTLAKSLYNDEEVSKCFKSKIWIWVGEQFEVKVVVKKIIESATKNKFNVEGMEALQTELQRVIGGIKYLLVMDDVWNESDVQWHALKSLFMGGARGSKILITKRDSKIPSEIGSMTSLFPLEGLRESNSWSLFSKVAFKEGKEPANPNMIQLGKEILLKCGGVPLVIRHIGRLLYSKTSEEEWISFKDNELLEVIEEDNDTTSILKLSYNHLPPNLKQCFAYLSLYPKGKSFKIKELIRQWVAHGFIQLPKGSKSMEDLGKDYFKELCWRFFVLNSSDECNFEDDVRMHDVIHDLAVNVGGERYVRGNSNYNYVVGEKTRHVSIDHEIKSGRDLVSKLRKARGLRTLHLRVYEEKNFSHEDDLEELFSSFPRLRVLSLSNSNIHEVPKSIRKLRHLRYLDLSNNDIQLLPGSITELQNLQTLNLSCCLELKNLPRDVSSLVYLRHMDLDPYLQLTDMPEGLGKLRFLQTLNLFVLDSKRSNKLSELNEMNLTRELRIRGLEQLRSTPSEASLVNLKDQKGLQHLTLKWEWRQDEYEGEADEIVMERLGPHRNLESLIINGYSGVGLPNWVCSSLLKLTEINIVNCHRLEHLPPRFDHLEALKTLCLQNLRSLKFIDQSDPYSSAPIFFPSLTDLLLSNIPNLEGWWDLGRESRVVEVEEACEKNKWLPPTFPQLNFLHIYHCPKLTSMPKLASTKADVFLQDVGAQFVTSTIVPISCFKTIHLRKIKDLESIPEELQQQNLVSLDTSTVSYWPSFRNHLIIGECPNLMNLPEWIGTLTSLQYLTIQKCHKLKSLPEGMRQLKYLKQLNIEDCPKLLERCEEGGEDWPKISHIPDITLGTATPSFCTTAVLWEEQGDFFHERDFIPERNELLWEALSGLIPVAIAKIPSKC